MKARELLKRLQALPEEALDFDMVMSLDQVGDVFNKLDKRNDAVVMNVKSRAIMLYPDGKNKTIEGISLK